MKDLLGKQLLFTKHLRKLWGLTGYGTALAILSLVPLVPAAQSAPTGKPVPTHATGPLRRYTRGAIPG